MPKVLITFKDTPQEDKNGFPVVDIKSSSFPQFPEDSATNSPAQKAAITFLSRGPQPDVTSFLALLYSEAVKLTAELEKVKESLLDEASSGALPFDVEMMSLRVKDIRSMIEETVQSFV